MIIEIYYYTQKKTPTAFLGQLVFFCVINIQTHQISIHLGIFVLNQTSVSFFTTTPFFIIMAQPFLSKYIILAVQNAPCLNPSSFGGRREEAKKINYL
jgi:hypothetical protein